MTVPPRPEVQHVCEAAHGAIDYAELAARGIDPASIADFSVCTQPFGPSPRVAAALAQVAVDRYPDRDALQLRSVLGERWRVSPDRLIAGNGSSELLYLIALAYLRPGDPVLIVGPTYGEYARVATLMGARPRYWTASNDDGFQVSHTAVARRLREVQPRICFLCNPNNPTGRLLPADTIRSWAEEFPHTLFVIDEAYLEFAPGARTMAGMNCCNLVVLRSLTKAYGLAGLRLGCGVADPEIIALLRRVRPPWSVSAAAQLAGIAAVEDESHLRQSLARIRRAKPTLLEALASQGYAPVPSAVHFFLVPISAASQVRAALLQVGILVRNCASFGLPAFIRLSTRTPPENARLADALRQLDRSSHARH